MATTVGNESDFESLVTNLIYLERDTIAAYDSAITRLSHKELRQQIDRFKDNHLQHLEVLDRMAREAGAAAPREGDMKEMVITGKIAMADLGGDAAILRAMKSNEDDTVTAYERAGRHEGALPESRAFFEKALADERRHRAWMQETAEAL